MKQELLAELLERLSSFCVHEQLLKELVALVSKGGITPRFLPLFYRRLNQLEEFGVQAPEKHAEFERLDRDLYSMHISSRDFNIRVLYAFLPDQAVLLLAFYERGGKSNTDYTRYIPAARRRLEELED